MRVLETLSRFQENSYVRATEVNCVLCPIVSGLGNTCVAIIRLLGSTMNAASNSYNSLRNKQVEPKTTQFKDALQQLAWGILMMLPGVGVGVGRMRAAYMANESKKSLEKASSSQQQPAAASSSQQQPAAVSSQGGNRKIHKTTSGIWEKQGPTEFSQRGPWSQIQKQKQ
jgi:hypothetical protein